MSLEGGRLGEGSAAPQTPGSLSFECADGACPGLGSGCHPRGPVLWPRPPVLLPQTALAWPSRLFMMPLASLRPGSLHMLSLHWGHATVSSAPDGTGFCQAPGPLHVLVLSPSPLPPLASSCQTEAALCPGSSLSPVPPPDCSGTLSCSPVSSHRIREQRQAQACSKGLCPGSWLQEGNSSWACTPDPRPCREQGQGCLSAEDGPAALQPS